MPNKNPASPTNPKPGDPKPKSKAKPIGRTAAPSRPKPRTSARPGDAAPKRSPKTRDPIKAQSITRAAGNVNKKMAPIDPARYAGKSVTKAPFPEGSRDNRRRAEGLLMAESGDRHDRRSDAQVAHDINFGWKQTPNTPRAKGMAKQAMNKKRGQRSGNG